MASSLSRMVHKAGDKIDEYAEKNRQSKQSGNTNNATYNNSQSTNAGPHNSNMMNKVDPRVDSDRDGRNNPASRVGGYGQTQHTNEGYSTTGGPGGYGGAHTGTHTGAHNTGMHTGTHNTSSGYGNTNNPGYNNPQSANAGPHNSNMLNKLDPRVDSDRDGRNDPTSHTGGYGQTQGGYGSGVGHTGSTQTHHATTGHGNTNHSAYNNPQSNNAGPHNSNMLNKLDPRVDSDRDGRNNPTSHTGGYGQTQSGYGSNTGAGYGSTTTTTHHPTVVSSTTHGGQHGGSQGYTGANTGYDNPQSTNAGPHKSNMMNKLDPRVDSDRDGRNDPSSRTGGYGNTQTGGHGAGY